MNVSLRRDGTRTLAEVTDLADDELGHGRDRPTEHEFVLEEAEDAYLDGDRAAEVGTVRTALRHRDFRTVVLGMFASNIGTWMQNVIVVALAYDITGSAWFVSLVGFANLAPQLLLSLFGGALADAFDRRKLILWLNVEQLVGSLLLAWIVASPDPSRPALLFAVAFVGTGMALQSPVFLSLTPTMVPRSDLAAAVSLNSVSMNVARVVGPAIGGVLYALVGASVVFLGNAVTYLAIMVAIVRVTVPAVPRPAVPEGPVERLLGGVRYVVREPIVRRCVATILLFSLFCMAYLVVMPVLAEESFGVPAKSTTYGFLYAVFGLGAVVGALSIGTFLAGRSLESVVRATLGGFAVALATFGLVRTPVLAFPVGFVLGFFYFAAVTSLATVFQARLDDAVRGRASAVWVMSFGGVVPIGGLAAGWVASTFSVTVVVLAGAATAAFLAWYCDLRPSGLRRLRPAPA
jgi:MFS family permease